MSGGAGNLGAIVFGGNGSSCGDPAVDLPGTIIPQYFGAVGDGATDDSAAFQAMFDAVNLDNPEVCYIPPAAYLINTQIDLPKHKGGDAQLLITGYGAILKTTSAIDIFSRRPADQTEAGQIVSAAINLKGVKFEGNNLAGQRGLFLGATYASTIRDCQFFNFDNGFTLSFALMTGVYDTRVQNCNIKHIDINTGVGEWTGASLSNSQSNNSTLKNVRVYAKLGAESCLHVEGCSGVSWDNLICEGANPVNNVVFDGANSSVVKEFGGYELHPENTPSNADIKLQNTIANSTFTFNRIFKQFNTIFVDNSGSVNVDINVINVPNLPIGTKFKGDARWIFKESISLEAVTRDSVYWDDATVRGRYIGDSGTYIERKRGVLSVSSNNFNIDWGNKNEFKSTNVITLGAATTITFSNTDNAEFATFTVVISPSINTLTFPDLSGGGESVISGDQNWSSLVWTPPAVGTYTIGIKKTGTLYEVYFTQTPAS